VLSQKLAGLKITVVDVFDEYALSNQVREQLYKSYPLAKLAHLKSGGNFPYLSRSDEVNLHLQVGYCKSLFVANLNNGLNFQIHLRSFDETNLWAREPRIEEMSNKREET